MEESQLGPYRLIRRIASGGTAEVFLARQVGEAGFDRPVVVKRLWRELARHDEVLHLFQREARLLSVLSHPTVPQVLDFGRADGQWYIALEHVEGVPLSALFAETLRSEQQVPFEAALGVGRQLCSALHHVHERRDGGGRPLGVVHCDVTPENVVVTAEGYIKLLDFGVARTEMDPEPPSAVRGTTAYMAPEQITGSPVDRRVDVYSSALLLYELTTGSRARQGSDVEMMTRAVERDVEPPASLREGFPARLQEVLLQALAREPSHRPASARELSRRLGDVARGEGWLPDAEAVAGWVSRCRSPRSGEPEPC